MHLFSYSDSLGLQNDMQTYDEEGAWVKKG